MNKTFYFLATCISLYISAASAMEAINEISAFIGMHRQGGININQANIGIREAHVNHAHVTGEQQYIIQHHHVPGETQLHQEYNPAQKFARQMLHSCLSGVKQSLFDIGNSAGKFTDYATKIGASVAIGITIDLIRNAWTHLFNAQQLAEQKKQKVMLQLATEQAIIQSIATQLKNLPRQTEQEKEAYHTLQTHYVSMFKKFTEHAADYMSETNQTKITAKRC